MKYTVRKILCIGIGAFCLIQAAGCREKVETVQVGTQEQTVQIGEYPEAQSASEGEAETGMTAVQAAEEETERTGPQITEEQIQAVREQIREAEKHAGFAPATIPEVTGYVPNGLNELWEGEGILLEVIYELAEGTGSSFYTRKAEGEEDISGISGVEYTETDINGRMVRTGEAGGRRVAVWQDGIHTCAAVGSGMEQDEFLSLVGACLVSQQ